MKTRDLNLFCRLLCAVLFASGLSLTGCDELNNGIQESKDRLDTLTGTTIPGIEGQITAITGSIEDLKRVDSELDACIDSLEQHAARLQEHADGTDAELSSVQSTLRELKAADVLLDRKIADLQTYTDSCVNSAKDWANVTFSTLAQYEETQTALSSLSASIVSVADSLTASYLSAISSAVSASESGMKVWVNSQLAEGYYDIAAIDGRLLALSGRMDESDADLQKQIDEQKVALQQAKTDLTAAYTAAISDAITTNNGVINAAMASKVKAAQDALQSQIDVITTTLSQIQSRLDRLEGRIQSLRYLPEYENGVAILSTLSRCVVLDFLVSPSYLAESVAASWNTDRSVLSGYLRYTKSVPTRAVAEALPLDVLSVTGSSDGVLSVVLRENSSAPISEGFLLGECGAVAYIVISDGNNNVSSEIVKVEAGVLSETEYSTDGKNWSPVLPSTFGTLYVRGEVSEADLSAIKTAIDAQSEPAGLDMSESTYESATFPAIFSATADAPDTKLKSIKFPHNVTTIAVSAFLYCSAMTSVDLTGITIIGKEAFRYCGLETLNVPNTVSSYGTYVFADNYSLTAVYYNSPYDPGMDAAANRFTFHLTNKDIADPCLVVTIGPDTKRVPRCCFRNNNSLIKIIIEGASYFRQYAICYCENLAVLEYRCTDAELLTTDSIGFGSIHANTNVEEYPGNNLPTSERKVIVPAGMASVYTPLLSRLLNSLTVGGESHNYGYTIIDDTTPTFTVPSNCYIVSDSGTYKFSTVKGNSSESVGSVARAEVLWESFGTDTAPAVGDLIKSVSYSNGYIAFQTADTFREGNAVIAAKDASGNILWSWHIWLTDEPEGQVYYNNAGTMMDRNLGATSATPGDIGALGLLYQWGRKDPFLGSSSISTSTLAKSTISWPSVVPSNSSRGTIEYATAHPTTFITYNSYNYDWYYTGSSSTDNTRWTESDRTKSIYDPCPAGWRVPDGWKSTDTDSDINPPSVNSDDNVTKAGVWSKALGSSSYFTDSSLYNSTNEGMNFSGKFGSASTIWYPASGSRYYTDGDLDNVGYYGYYWSASPDSRYAYNLCFNDHGIVNPSNNGNYRAVGQSVRCLQE